MCRKEKKKERKTFLVSLYVKCKKKIKNEKNVKKKMKTRETMKN